MTGDEAWERLAAARVGRLATTAPRIVPVTFAVVGEAIVHAVDHKPKATRELARIADIRRDPRVSLLVDRYDEDWSRLWWVSMRGAARVLPEGSEAEHARDLLVAKYDQYRRHRPAGPVLAVEISEWRAWSAG